MTKLHRHRSASFFGLIIEMNLSAMEAANNMTNKIIVQSQLTKDDKIKNRDNYKGLEISFGPARTDLKILAADKIE